MIPLLFLLLAAPSVYFSPHGGATEAVVREVNAATKTINVLAYGFTSPQIAQALVDAEARGVDVEVILDKSNTTAKATEEWFVLSHGVAVRIDSRHAIAHSKVMIIDGETIISGSFNFTTAAEEHNSENLLVISDEMLAAKYLANFRVHEAHSRQAHLADAGVSP